MPGTKSYYKLNIFIKTRRTAQANHSAIYAKMNVGTLDHHIESETPQRRSCWAKANEEAKDNFKSTLATKLNDIPEPGCIHCLDIHCQSSQHMDSMEEYTMSIMEALESAGMECLPSSGGTQAGGKNTPIPGWKEHVGPYLEESKFWYQVWLSAGKPAVGTIFENMKQSKKQFKFAVRRLKKCSDRIQNDKFVTSLLQGGSNIFQEIRKARGTTSTFSSRIDEEVGAHNIADHFASIYEQLYNKVEPGGEFEKVRNEVLSGVTVSSQLQIQRVNDNVIKDALNLMKAKKNDAIFNIASDFYLNGPPELIPHLTKLVKTFLSHGRVPSVILLCTLLPLVKDNLGDRTSSENYRAIAGGCLLLKLIDLVILQLEGEKLNFDELQFAYQAKASTTMCTWSVTSVVDHYLRCGTPVYGAAMDMSKAFDMVEWGELFKTLMARKVDHIFLRLILFIYSNQQCDVRWCGKYSARFTVNNGVRQGGVSSGIFFAVYIDKLLTILREAGHGCHINGMFFGAMIFADDIFLLSASRNGLQRMVDICQEFVASRNLKFGTNVDPDKSKTKCIVFAKRRQRNFKPANILLNCDRLPWVNHVKHLGHTLQSDNSMSMDVAQKRGAYIGKINSLMQEFHSVTPDVFFKLMNTYALSIYGSNTWDILSADCEKLYASFNVTIRNVLKIDRQTHRYLIEPLSGCTHLKTLISSRYATFYHSLINSKKKSVRFLARISASDQRTVMGRTLSSLLSTCKLKSEELPQLNAGLIKKNMVFSRIPSEDEWRIPLGQELLQLRDRSNLDLPGFSLEEQEEILHYLCVT